MKLRGRLQFAAGNLFGRIARSSLAIITQHAYISVSSKLDPRSVMALQLHVKLLKHSRPRELRASANNVWFIQTDACYEPGDDEVFAGVGAVLFNSAGQPLKFFGQRLSPELLKRLNPTSKKNATFECEFFAFFTAFLLWGSETMDAVVIYTDNNAVRDSMTSCHTANDVAKKILAATLGVECEQQLTPWYSRVPMDSNLADGPSRLKFDQRLGACISNVDLQKVWDKLEALAEKWGEEQAPALSQVQKG